MFAELRTSLRPSAMFLADEQFRDTQTAKPPAFGKPRLCLVPHTRPFLGQQSLGVEPAGEGDAVIFTVRPHASFREGGRPA